MDLLESLKDHSLTAVSWWAGFCVAFYVLTRLCPCNPGRSWWTAPRAALTDFIYWLLLMPLMGLLGRIALLWLGVMVFYGQNATPQFVARSWPLWFQCVIILLLQDVLMYWSHRLFHTRRGWAFHAVHHSPETLDWTSSARFHPVNEIGQYALADALALMLGFSPVALVTLAPIHQIHFALVHANLNWTFGPLRYVFASPVFHRWHHTSQEEGRDKNFAPVFPFLDLLWGTFYMPAGKLPEAYGANEPDMPPGPLGQTLFPFRGAGQWLRGHPTWATACVLVSAALCYASWHYLTRPTELQEVTQRPDDLVPEPGILPSTVTRDPKLTTAVAVNAPAARALYGKRDGTITIRDVLAGRESTFEHHKSRINSLATSPDGKLAVSASSDGTAVVFDTETGAARRVLSHKNTNVMCAAVSADGWATTGRVDGLVGLWDPSGKMVKQRNLSARINAIAVSESGRQVVAAQGSLVITWATATDGVTVHRGLTDLAYCVAVSAGGRRIVAGGYDGQLYAWDQDGERPRLVVKGHTGPIYSVSISPDGESIVTGGADQTARMWDGASGALVKEFHGHTALIFAVSFDQHLRRVLAGGRDELLTSWNVTGEGVVPATQLQPKPIDQASGPAGAPPTNRDSAPRPSGAGPR
jgi:sterol desaturase/sphingolipid hydroxylase (fatty acid hydroxylase superfamily)